MVLQKKEQQNYIKPLKTAVMDKQFGNIKEPGKSRDLFRMCSHLIGTLLSFVSDNILQKNSDIFKVTWKVTRFPCYPTHQETTVVQSDQVIYFLHGSL